VHDGVVIKVLHLTANRESGLVSNPHQVGKIALRFLAAQL